MHIYIFVLYWRQGGKDPNKETARCLSRSHLIRHPMKILVPMTMTQEQGVRRTIHSSFQIHPTPFWSSDTNENPNADPPSAFPPILASFQPFLLGSLEWTLARLIFLNQAQANQWQQPSFSATGSHCTLWPLTSHCSRGESATAAGTALMGPLSPL